MIIIGAGLSGLLAGALDRRAKIIEMQKGLPHNHHAVLRFRDDKIGRALNMPFRKVRVLKGIWHNSEWVQPTPDIANSYARKVTGAIVDRSILDIRPVERFIAPKNFIERLAEACNGRIDYGVDAAKSWATLPRPLISTIPLPHMLNFAQIDWGDDDKFRHQSIKVVKFRVPGADVFQTVYFPAKEQCVYRATLTGDELALECVGEGPMNEWQQSEALWAFGLRAQDVEMLDAKKQGLGKILPLPDTERKAILWRLTREHGVYSLGRFACWRNSLLDDVYEDYFRIRRMMELGEYDVMKGVVQ